MSVDINEAAGWVFTQISVMGLAWLPPLGLAVFLTALLTKEPEKMKAVFLPIAGALHILGAKQHVLILILGAIMWATSTVSRDLVRNVLVVGRGFGKIRKELPRIEGKTLNQMEQKKKWDKQAKELTKKNYNKSLRTDESMWEKLGLIKK